MRRTIRAKFKDGVLVPLEPVEFGEGDEILISFDEAYNLSPEERLEISMASAGGWVGSVDADKLIRDIYTSRHRGFDCDCIYCAPEG
jgi:predicted DNA-binding antitoxin AbrB/MazE fold protein